MNIIQLVPHLPPLATGIGDYSVEIARKLLENQNIFTHFITYELWFSEYVKEHPYIDQFPVKRLKEHGSDHFLSLLPDKFEGVILHYNFVERQETALWLLHNLRIARKKHNFKLVVMFHELTTSFKRKGLNLPAPKHIFSCLSTGMMADSIVTNNSISQTYLSKWLRRKVFCLPNFSNIGEPSHIPSLSERNRTIIVFGSKSRRSVYQKFSQELSECCKILEIEKIYDIGPSCGVSFSDLPEMPIVEMGIQQQEVISELMLTSFAGFVDYSHSLGKLGKSTIFAAYCSHGLLPINSVDNCSQFDGLEVNKNYVLPSKQLQSLNFQQLDEIANNAHKWYGKHSLDKVVEIFASCLCDNKV
ncbi:hypothetical protein [Limnofasciculus baicalensis]|uniref:Glycosyltransferase family 1 protein n=1 Tax=Limnofasciculus baicalensis BBK-W-15 TaxID=2699891 RepID=A0AAE3KRE1_9CYAN|nr:hypothetical protein [Limnofasciculus baicalensis]MCP2731578.1 hypothetical protein [Limnofasciculus baicalensis BBK-W-15]